MNVRKCNFSELNLNRSATPLTYEEMKNRNIGEPDIGFRWEKDDDNSNNWVPQGTTNLLHGDETYVAISWYDSNETKGVRVSIADVTNLKSGSDSLIPYRHILLVESSDKGTDFVPINIHAGGLASVDGSFLYVVDTELGVRVFDLSSIYAAVEDEHRDQCGIIDGQVLAYNYRYILPQIMSYDLTMAMGTNLAPRFSFCSIDWTTPDKPLLLTGNYTDGTNSGKYGNGTPVLVWWNLNGWMIDASEPCNNTLADTGLIRTQGACSDRSSVWFSVSGKGLLTAMNRNSTPPNMITYKFPEHCEDLSMLPDADLIWCNTENAPGERIVFAVKSASVPAPSP